MSSSVIYARLMAKARLRHLQLLVAVADEGNLGRAAADVCLSQPASTQVLAELEQLLGGPLFERHAKGMRLTPAGSAVIPVVRNVLEALRASTETLAALHEGARGLLRVGVIGAMATAVLGERVLRFCEQRPGLRVEIVEDAAPHLLQELMSGELNLMLGRRPCPVPAKLHYEVLRPDDAMVLAGPGHPLAGRRGLTLADLQDYPWMRAPQGVWVREVFDDLFDAAGWLPRLHPVSTASIGPLPEILRDDHTVALIPATLGRTLERWRLAVALDLKLGTPRGEIGLLYAEAMDDPRTLEFIEALRPPPETG